MKTKNFIFFICLVLVLILINQNYVYAQTVGAFGGVENDAVKFNSKIFEARVLEVIDDVVKQENAVYTGQKLRLRGLDGDYQNQEIIFDMTDLELVAGNIYAPGDRVLVEVTVGPDGKENFFVTDFVRRQPLYWLGLIFVLIILIIGRQRGLRAIIGLVFSFWLIIKLLIPRILAGNDPLWTTVWVSLIIVVTTTYITYGFNKKSSLAISGTLVGVLLVGGLSIFFSQAAKLAGIANEEILFLVGMSENMINLRGLLLAGIMIGALGVLDDLTISQVSVVEQLKKVNSELSAMELYKRAMNVGTDHIASMVNTLFLAYAGVALPLLLLFVIKQEPFLNFSQVINHEVVATEIIRALVGSIGLALAVPITTYWAAIIYSRFKKIK